jgi:iron complex outermembrane receptor protein
MKTLLVSLLSPIVFCIPLNGQESTNVEDTTKVYHVDEVVVTATRTAKRIIDVPYSIELIQPSQFRFEKKTSVDNILGMVPGLFFQNRYGNHDVRISIRGFGSRSNSGIRGVRILLDGIPESEPDGQTRIEAIDFQSVGSIEIVKGNSSSLYTNAPGGVINFINDINFTQPSITQFNEFGSFGLHSNGFKLGLQSKYHKFLTTYNYHSAKGYRPHSEDYWHISNTVLRTTPDDRTQVSLYGYFVDGLIRLPGSLTRAQYDTDPFQPNSRDLGRDAKRITKKGRIGIQYDTYLDEEKGNELQLVGYGTIKYFERTARTYRIINRTGVGASGRFVNHSEIFGRKNEFSFGGDLLHQTGPIEEYDNLGGKKGDRNLGITDETIGNVGFYVQNSINLMQDRFDLLLTGRYDKVVFDAKDQVLEVRSDTRRFGAFTPKAALNYKITPVIAAYTSFGFSFDSPAANELDNFPLSSTYPKLLNPDLKAQQSRNFELGVKGHLSLPDQFLISNTFFDVTFFNSTIQDEVVPFEVSGEVFFRNAAKTNRTGLEVGVNTQVMNGLRWRTAYTYSDFTYKAYTARAADLLGNVTDHDFSGNRVPSVPQHNLSLSLTYERPLTDHLLGFVKGTYTNVSGMYVDDANSERSKGYQVVNSSVGFDILLGRFNILVSGGVNNIFDLTYVAFININSERREFYEVGEPRHFFASVNFGLTL